MLYWAEGTKGRNTVAFSNSDPAMVAFFVRFLRTCFGLRTSDLTFRLNVYTTNGPTLTVTSTALLHDPV